MTDETPYYDTRIRSDLPANKSIETAYLNVGESSGIVYRSLLLFKFDQIPTNLKSAVLSLFWSAPASSRKNDTILEVYRPAAWAPSGVGWNYSVKSLKWKKSGGDWFDRLGKVNGSTPFASCTVKAGDLVGKGRYIDIDITELVKGIREGTYPNTGLLIKAKTEKGDYLQLSSFEGSNKPKITYVAGADSGSSSDSGLITDLSGYIVVNGPGTDAIKTIQAAINSATLGKGIYLNGGYNYILGSGHISMKTGINILGDPTAVVIGTVNTGGARGSKEIDGWFYGNKVNNIKIGGFKLISQATAEDRGHGNTRNMIAVDTGSNIVLYELVTDGLTYNDFARFRMIDNALVDHCIIKAGHDGIEFLKCTNSKATNNDIIISINCGIRVYNSSDIEIDHNNIKGFGGTGWTCLEMQSALSGVKIHHNILHDFKGSSNSLAVGSVGASGSVSVENNVLWNIGSIAYGTTKDNIINPSDKVLENWQKKGYGIQG